MNTKSRRTRWMAATAGIVLGLMTGSGAIAAPEDSPCGCWYDGFEDGTEYSAKEITRAEFFAECKKRGNQSPYEQGFTAGQHRQERKCPL